jgi:biopolymer transport protein ExbB/TolQ
MIDLVREIWLTGSVNLIMLFFVIAFCVLAFYTIKYAYAAYNLRNDEFTAMIEFEEKKINLLIARADQHDKEHIEMNAQVRDMLKEMKHNREQDKKQAEITHKLVHFLADKSKIKIPEL